MGSICGKINPFCVLNYEHWQARLPAALAYKVRIRIEINVARIKVKHKIQEPESQQTSQLLASIELFFHMS